MTAPPGPGVVIRPATRADLPEILAIYNHAVRELTATFDTQERTPEAMEHWFMLHDGRHPLFVAVAGAVVVGWASLSAYSDRAAYARTVEDTIYVRQDYWGRRVGAALLAALLDAARDRALHTIIARITADNAVSRHLHARCGFIEVGTLRQVGWKFGRWLDVVVMQAFVAPTPDE